MLAPVLVRNRVKLMGFVIYVTNRPWQIVCTVKVILHELSDLLSLHANMLAAKSPRFLLCTQAGIFAFG